MIKSLTNLTSVLKNQISFHPWVYFIIFLASNSLLSYFPLSLTDEIWVALFGLTIPFLVALGTVSNKRSKTKNGFFVSKKLLSLSDNETDPPVWLWSLFIFLLLLTRFYRLTTLPFWPLHDEAAFSTIAMGLMKQWHWNILWSEYHYEPFLIWSLGLFFKIFPPSILSIRLFTTFISLATVFLCYWASRRFFPRWTSFVFCWLFAFSFWEFSLMRFCTQEIFIPFFQFLSFGLLGIFLQKKQDIEKWLWLLLLSLVAGLGFYSYINWMVAWFLIFFVIAMSIGSRQNRDWKYLGIFTGVSFLSALPWLIARLDPRNLSYVHELFSPASVPLAYGRYFYGLLWRSRDSFPFGPDWGGMFDPITGSLIFIGIIHLIKVFPKTFCLSFGILLLVSMLPGAVTNYMELHRITPSLPLWIFLGILGVKSFFSSGLNKKTHNLLMIVLLLGILILNAYDFAGPYNDIQRPTPSRQWRAVQYFDAFQILQKINSEEKKPILIFSEFNTDYENKTLNLGTYPFNPVRNQTINPSQADWVAVITDIQFAPYFIKKFPTLKFKVLKTDKFGPNDPPPLGIFIFPVSLLSSQELNQWIRWDHVFWDVDMAIKNNNLNEPWSSFADRLALSEKSLPQDPFLKAIYWKNRGFFEFISFDFKPAIEDYQKAIQQGLPAAQLYYDLGVSLKFSGQASQANEAFKKAKKMASNLPI